MVHLYGSLGPEGCSSPQNVQSCENPMKNPLGLYKVLGWDLARLGIQYWGFLNQVPTLR